MGECLRCMHFLKAPTYFTPGAKCFLQVTFRTAELSKHEPTVAEAKTQPERVALRWSRSDASCSNMVTFGDAGWRSSLRTRGEEF